MSDLHVLSAGAAKGLAEAIAADFERESGTTVRARFGAVGAMRETLLAGEPCDVFVSTAAIVEALSSEGRLDPASAAPIGRVHTAIAVCAGDPVPAIATAAGLAHALHAAPEIHFPDPDKATAGIHFMKVLDALGVRHEIAARLRPHPNGATAMRELARSAPAGAIGCTQVTEVLYTPSVSLAGRLPREFELATVYSAAVCAAARGRGDARAYVAWLTGPRTAELRRRGGFED
ncbi:MAG: substrate-binding domain-containing protein [Burkholderiales bacterium]|nr:substrate-binding domain-containing protein [Burkholderiales bacterium]